MHPGRPADQARPGRSGPADHSCPGPLFPDTLTCDISPMALHPPRGGQRPCHLSFRPPPAAHLNKPRIVSAFPPRSRNHDNQLGLDCLSPHPVGFPVLLTGTGSCLLLSCCSPALSTTHQRNLAPAPFYSLPNIHSYARAVMPSPILLTSTVASELQTVNTVEDRLSRTRFSFLAD